MHAPEVECIGKGKAHRPYEFGVKVSLATTLHRSRGGQFIAHAEALPGNPYDGHTLATVIRRPRHRSAPTSPASSPTAAIAAKRELRRRSAVEPVIGHAKAEHRMGRNHLAGAHSDAANAVLAAAGYNFRRLLAWLAALWRAFIMAVLANARDAPIPAPNRP